MLQIHHSFKACLSGTFLFNIHSVLLEKKVVISELIESWVLLLQIFDILGDNTQL